VERLTIEAERSGNAPGAGAVVAPHDAMQPSQAARMTRRQWLSSEDVGSLDALLEWGSKGGVGRGAALLDEDRCG
jgi:hypothetical protein